ncbi:hypothetical protein D1007_23772 [Hordeum vulgare]|nr:hypothetical protein D1007_23772 [Hordeum vulgare]
MQHREEECGCRIVPFCDVEAEESGRVELAQTAEEGAVGGLAERARADAGGTDEAGREADADDDLRQEVVFVEHLGHTRRQRPRLPTAATTASRLPFRRGFRVWVGRGSMEE